MRVFPALIRNIGITAVAYTIISGIGLLLAPILIALYGLGGYGQILLARMFLPTAVFGMLDLGIGETTTRAVAAANHGTGWEEAAGVLSLLCALATMVGLALGGALFVGADLLTRWLSISAEQSEGFSSVLMLTGALLPILFLSLVAEGVLKGLERFKVLRACEIASALTYCALSLVFGFTGFGPNWIAIALIAGLLLRFMMASGAAIVLLRAKGVRFRRWSVAVRRDLIRWSQVMLASKVLGTLQAQVGSPIIGFLLGPVAVGAYDAVIRLPRFAKSLFSLISTTVLPAATGLRARSDDVGTGELATYGILGSLAVATPAAVFGAVYSEPLLRHWIGPEVADFWVWQSMTFLIALLNVPLSFGGAVVLANRPGLQRTLRLAAVQVGLQIVLSLALLSWLSQWAFVAGHLVSVLIVIPFQLVCLREEIGFNLRIVASFAQAAVVCAAIAVLIRLNVPAEQLTFFIASAVLYALAMYALLPWLLLDGGERKRLFSWLKRVSGSLRVKDAKSE